MPRAAKSWTCPKCGRRFANRNQWHSCGKFTVQEHLDRAGPKAASLYRQLETFLRSLGPVDVSPSGTIIAFKNGATFASVAFRGGRLRVGVLLDHVVDHPRFVALESVSPESHAHAFLVNELGDLDAQAEAWLREAYELALRRRK